MKHDQTTEISLHHHVCNFPVRILVTKYFNKGCVHKRLPLDANPNKFNSVHISTA
jgi:hypothetical protein